MTSPFADRLLVLLTLAATTTLAGCQGRQSLTPAERAFVVTPSTVDFSVVPQGEWLDRHLSVQATGRAGLTLTLTVSPPFSAPAQVRLPPGTAVEVVVRFTSPGPGSSAADLRLSDGEHEQVVSLVGMGAAACAAPDDPCFEMVFDHTDEACVARPLQEGAVCRRGCLAGTCQLGVCLGQTEACDDGNPCTVDACGQTGCLYLPRACEASDPCHVGTCAPDTGCGASEVADGTSCGPRTCREVSICLSGVCQVRARPNAQTDCEYVSISGNSDSFCAITRGGDSMCWGDNLAGQLNRGYFSQVGAVAPMQLGGARVQSVAASLFDTCISSATEVSCAVFSSLGRGLPAGRLHYNGVELCSEAAGTVRCSQTPSPVASIEPIEKFSLGPLRENWSCAIADGGVWCLPMSNNLISASPVAVALPGRATEVVSIDGYQASGCARLADSSAWCWGGAGAVPRQWLAGGVTALGATNMENQLLNLELFEGPLAVCAALVDRTECLGADPSLADGPRPSYRLAALGDVQQLAVGFETVCAVLDGGSIACIGANHQGSLGDRSEQPAGPQVAAFRASRVWGAGDHTLFVGFDGGGWQWGSDQPERLGDGGVSEFTSSGLVALGDEPVAVSVSGLGEVCWLDHAGAVWCRPPGGVARQAVPGGATLFAADHDGARVCAVTPGGVNPVTCSGRRGVSPGSAWPSWLRVAGGPVSMVTLGDGVCVLRDGGEVWCSPAVDSLLQPVTTLGPVTHLCTRDSRACAVTPTGAVQCWSRTSQSGPLSFEPLVTVEAPVRGLSCGRDFVCTVSRAGKVQCWGDNRLGQLGRDGPGSARPVEVPLTGPAQGLGAGDEHACAVLSSGTVQCWGNNWLGQLGVPRRLRADAPRLIQD